MCQCRAGDVRSPLLHARTAARQPLQVVVAGHGRSAPERAQVRGQPLHVEQRGAGLAQPVDEGDQRHLGSVRGVVEHRLAGEEPADAHAVQPTDQVAVVVAASTLCAQPSSCRRV